MKTLSPAVLTASSDSAWMKAAVLSSAVSDGLVERLDAGVGLAGGDGLGFVGGERVRCAGGAQRWRREGICKS
jgi:hypothetical protein